jgi:Cd2+/Zn2+-exporting ATPase
MLALIVLFFTKDLNRVIALLLVSCPCSIVLATPTAIVAALSAAARLGVLVKNVQDLERARMLTAILFDKTGTLTTGTLTVTRLGPMPGNEPAQLLSIAASLERHSNHPTARAVMEIAGRARVTPKDVKDFEEVSGRGVRGVLDGEQVLVGRMAWLQEQGIEMEFGDQEPPEGFSLLFVARAGRLIGWIGLEDKTRTDAAQAMDDLRDLGVKQLVMVTGDRWSVARRVASEMHCTDVQAEVLPAQKLKVVDGLRAKGHTVAVVGDGVNDAPALAAGDLSIAMGAAGSDVAIHSASVALMNNNLNRIPFLIRLSRQTARIINQGVVFSILYILVFVTLSAMGNIHPIVAAMLHAASSLVVVFNSARLVRAGEDLETIPHEQGAPVRDTLTPQPLARPATS